jgi:tellurite resistance protein TerC
MTFRQLYEALRRILVFAVGSTVLLLGLVLLFTPGPAFVVIPIGLAILAIEFTWARHWLRKVRELIAQYNGNVSTPDSTSRAREGSKNDVA